MDSIVHDLTANDKKWAFLYLVMVQGLTGGMVQVYVPTISILLAVDMAMPSAIMVVFGTFTTCCILSFMIFPVLLGFQSPRTVFMEALSLRCLSGLLHVIGVMTTDLRLITASRLLHGLTQGTLSLVTSWIGTRIQTEHRMTWIAAVTVGLMVGLTSGAALGSAVAALCPTAQLAEASPGVLAAICSGTLVLLSRSLFRDGSHMPKSSLNAGAEKQNPVPYATAYMCIVVVFGTNLGGLATEAFAGLLLQR